MQSALEVTNLQKNYGSFKAVQGISFTVKPGEIFALIGPNGAGKSTTLRMVATLLTPSGGSAKVAGYDLVNDSEKVRESISYLPEEAGAYKNLSGEAYLRFMARLYAKDAQELAQYIERARGISGLDKRLKDKISSYSKGMTRKLLLSRAMMTAPALTILDEPTSGLDIMNAREIRDTVKAMAKAGTAVLLSSHNMLEIEYLSDRVGIIYKGKLHDTGTPEELKAKYKAANLEEVFMEAIRS